MSYKSKIQIKESTETLRGILKITKDLKIKQKLQSLILYKESPDKKQEDIAHHLCIGYSTIKRWYRKYNKEGLDAFLAVPRGGGKPSSIPKEVHEALERKLHNSKDPLLGYWHAVQWVSSELGIEVNYQPLRMHMIKHFKTKLKAPRKSHYKKDEQAIEAFFKTAK